MAGQTTSSGSGQHEDLAHYEGPALTLGAALDEALARNPELIEGRADLGVKRERPAQQRSLAPPMLDASIWQWPVNTLNPANTNMYMFTATQELPGRGKRELRATVAEKDVAAAENDIDVRARRVGNAVKQAYAELFISRKAIEIHLASADLLRQVADVSQAKYTAGRTSQQDVLKGIVELSRMHEDIIRLDQRAKIATARLNTLLDRPIDSLIGPLGEPHESTVLPPIADLQRQALEQQPEIRGAQIAVARAEAELAVVRGDRKPDFTVQAGYQVMPQQTDAFLARVGITWPDAPWSRGRVDARVREAIAGVDAARASQKATENALRFSVQEAYLRAKAAEERAALLRSTIVPQSEQVLEVARIAYQADRGDFLALLDNERVLLDAQLGYYETLAEFEQAMADLERAVGTEVFPDMSHVVNREHRP